MACAVGCGQPDPEGADDAGASASATTAGDDGSGDATASEADTAAEGSTGADGSSDGGPPPLPDGFEPFGCDAVSPDVTVDRLCEESAPDDVTDPIAITCRLEGSCVDVVPPPKDELVVMTFNIERGLQMDAQLAVFADGSMPVPDVLLLVEADRGCARTDARNVAWEYAQALGMNHVFGVEFVELPRPGESITAPCEHGNAVLSRYPIGNVVGHRHETNKSWLDSEGEPRLGGRMAVLADLAVGEQIVHVQVLHFESDIGDGEFREPQAVELAELGNAQPHTAIIGGDTNAPFYMLDLANGTHNEGTTEAFFERGWTDAHAALPLAERPTHAPGAVIDILFTNTTATDPVVCPNTVCSGLSDHLPVWATVQLP